MTNPTPIYDVRVQIDGHDQPFTINRVATFDIEEALRQGARDLPHFAPGCDQDVTITIKKLK